MSVMTPTTQKKSLEPGYSPKPAKRTMRPTVASITRRPATPTKSPHRGSRSDFLSTPTASLNPKSFSGKLQRGLVTFPD